MSDAMTTLLVVEDNDLDVEHIERGLRKLGLTNPMLRAVDGQEALDLLVGDGSGGLKGPLVVLLDLNMPRMNGLEFLDRVRRHAELSETQVFVLTTSRHPNDLADVEALGVAGYICKPVEHLQLADILGAGTAD